VAVLFSEWCQMCNHVSASDAAYTRFVTQLQQDGLLKGDDISERFFRILTVMDLPLYQVMQYTLSYSDTYFESFRNLLLHTL
jgi:hypothetical protein